MKKYIALSLAVIFMLFVSCNKSKKESIERKPDAYYIQLLKNKLVENGIVNTSFHYVDFDKIDIEGKSHEQILSDFEKAIPIIKERFRQVMLKRTKELKIFLVAIKSPELIDKDPFYKEILAVENTDKQVIMYFERIFELYNNFVQSDDAKYKVRNDSLRKLLDALTYKVYDSLNAQVPVRNVDLNNLQNYEICIFERDSLNRLSNQSLQ